ncbi:MAG: EAL domain-containing protein, partial [Methylococcaceae bacterium]|nr:EAL domain-containing protein [Methylococcaceae bacterium]
SSGNFTTIKKLPWTLEVKTVAQSMNSMSNKIGTMIARLNNKLDSLSDSLKRDSLTNLLNGASFEVNLKQELATGQPGYAAFIKFDDLAGISKAQGHIAVNKLLIDFSNILKDVQQSGCSAYRLYGSEFALLLPSFDNQGVTELSELLQQKLTELGQQYNLDDLVHIGITRFERSSDFEKLSPAMVEAYEQARNIGHNAYFIKEDSISSMSELDWKSTITSAIENNTPEITLTSEAYNYSGDTAIKVMEEAFAVVKDDLGNTLSIGTFFSMAQEFGLEEELDKCIVNKIILLMEEKQQSVPVTINLSMNSIASPTFLAWLQARIEHSPIQHELLAFSITAYSAVKDITAFANFSVFVNALGAKTLLKRYSSDIIPVDLLKELHIDYIRLSKDLTTDISANSNKTDLLAIMHDVASLLEIKIIAEGVADKADFKLVKDADIYGIGR